MPVNFGGVWLGLFNLVVASKTTSSVLAEDVRVRYGLYVPQCVVVIFSWRIAVPVVASGRWF